MIDIWHLDVTCESRWKRGELFEKEFIARRSVLSSVNFLCWL